MGRGRQVNRVQFGQQDHAFLLVGVGARNDRSRRLGLAHVVRQVWRGRNRSGVREALLADERLACAEANTSGGMLDRAIRHHRFFSG